MTGLSARRIPAPRSGTTLVELMAAIVVLGIAMTGVAGMTFWAGRTASVSEQVAMRQSVLSSLVEQVEGTAFDALPELAGCVPGGDEQFGYLACVRVDEESANLRAVTVLVDPVTESVSSDSTVLLRARTTPATPF